MLLRLLLILLLAVSVAAAAQVPQDGTIDNLAYTPQSAKRLFFTGSYQGQSVHMVRGMRDGQGFWHIYTGAAGQRVRMTIDDRSGLRDILVLDSGLRITVRQVNDERTEYRLYAANRRFLTAAVLFRKEGRWLQGLMATESFQGYAALTQVNDISAQVNSAPATAGPGLSSQLERVWERLTLLPLARADDNLLRGFFSDSASDARQFFGAPGHEIFKAMLVGAAAFTVKLAQVSIGDGALLAAGAAAAPFIAAVTAGVVIGLAAERAASWLETKQLRGTASTTELFNRLTAPTRYTKEAEPVAPPPFTAPVPIAASPQREPAPASPSNANADAPVGASSNVPKAATPSPSPSRTRGNDPALNGTFNNDDDRKNKLVYAFGGGELIVSRSGCAVRHRYTTIVIAGINYLTYTSLSDTPAGCGGPMGAEFARTYKVTPSGILIESTRERPLTLVRGG
jgi:hypothetical protein